MKYKRIAVTGSLAYDHIMSMPGKFREHIMPDKIHVLNVSFIMDSFRKEFGGTAGNVSYCLSHLGTKALLFGSVGHDFDSYKNHFQTKTHVDLSGIKVYTDQSTSQGFVMTDKEDNQIWGFYEGAMKKERQNSLEGLIDQEDFLLIGPNDPVAMLQYVDQAIAMNLDYMFDPAFNVPHFDAEQLGKAISHSTMLIGNDYEMELIRRKLRWSETEFFPDDRIVVTTMGAEGAEIKRGMQTTLVKAAAVDAVVDPTGAGDAYRAGFIAGYIRDKTMQECGQMASVSSAYAVETYGTQEYSFSPEEFAARYRKNFNQDIVL